MELKLLIFQGVYGNEEDEVVKEPACNAAEQTDKRGEWHFTDHRRHFR
jgi:hypothetical protein